MANKGYYEVVKRVIETIKISIISFILVKSAGKI